MRLLILTFSLLSFGCGFAQKPTLIFAHNDYAKARPFQNAYSLRVSYIEADVFLRNGKLLVAHTRSEIDENKTLASLYLEPLTDQIKINNGQAYPEPGARLTLMIDIKTKDSPTLDAIVKQIEQFPAIISCRNLSITISGNMPAPAEWHKYPSYISFDGRPNISYSTDELKRVALISDSFKNYSSWNGEGILPADDSRKLETTIEKIHALKKPVRFWASPDLPNAWTTFVSMVSISSTLMTLTDLWLS